MLQGPCRAVTSRAKTNYLRRDEKALDSLRRIFRTVRPGAAETPARRHSGRADAASGGAPAHLRTVGDCAAVPRAGDFSAPTAQNATRQGQVAAANIAAVLHGRR